MKILIAGYGSIGRRHLTNLKALGESDLLLYRTHHSTLSEEEIQAIPVFTSLDEALQQKPNAVVIANPTALHLDVAIPCALAGCSILMEKPISHNLERVIELQQALKKGGGSFLSGFQFRFHPALQQVKQWLQQEKIGKVVFAKSHWGEYLPGWHPWEDYRRSYSARADLGGGVVNTLSHPFDYLRWLMGEVESLTAVTSNTGLELEVEDNADVLIRFAQGAAANVHLDYLQRPAQHTLELTGAKGRITWDNATAIARRYDATHETWEEFSPAQGFERNQLFLAEMSHFLRVARGEEAPICTLQDGIEGIRITEAVHRSAREGCLVKFN
jgi:predicted dehydrogenase